MFGHHCSLLHNIYLSYGVLMQVSEAIQGSTGAIQENKISIEEVEMCLHEVDENIDSLKQLDNILGNFDSSGF